MQLEDIIPISLLKYYMKLAEDLSKKGINQVKPPYVGAVVLDSNLNVIGTGYHGLVSGTSFTLHAEHMAINNCLGRKPYILITTLLPCAPTSSYNNRRKSCCELILECGIPYVIYSNEDRNPHFRKNPTNFLKDRGIFVVNYTLKTF
ncbi:MAG: hypothetical protein QXR96_00770 [Candidatus Woesearchaeota archaeon]